MPLEWPSLQSMEMAYWPTSSMPFARTLSGTVDGSSSGRPEVSSTQVRKLLASGGDASHLVPRSVLRAIQAAGTYRMTPQP